MEGYIAVLDDLLQNYPIDAIRKDIESLPATYWHVMERRGDWALSGFN